MTQITENVSILLVDDNDAQRRSMANFLISSGYFVTEAGTGKEALGYFRELKPDLIITDLRMPEMDGLEFIETVAKESEHTPFIIISGEGNMQDVIEGLRLGAWDYLNKPIFPLDLLKHSIDRALERVRLLRESQHYQKYLEEKVKQRTTDLLAQNQRLKKEIQEKEILQAQLLQAHKLESVGQLASGIAHEINTPTQFISSNVGFINDAFIDIKNIIDTLVGAAQQSKLSPALLHEALQEADWPYLETEIPKAIMQSQEGLTRVTKIVRAMKEFSHPGSNEAEPTDINHIIETTLTVARNEWKYSSEVVLDLAPDLPAVNCIADSIGQVMLNLLVNAAQSITEKIGKTPEGGKGRISIKTEMDGPSVLIHISDTGCGIAASNQAKIFDPFFTTKEVGKGTGQGLAIAYDVITRKHGGSLTFSTILGEGTTFTIRLPNKKSSGIVMEIV